MKKNEMAKKLGYLKGILNRSEADETTSVMVELLESLVDRVEELEDVVNDLDDYIDSVEEALDTRANDPDFDDEENEDFFPFAEEEEIAGDDEDFFPPFRRPFKMSPESMNHTDDESASYNASSIRSPMIVSRAALNDMLKKSGDHLMRCVNCNKFFYASAQQARCPHCRSSAFCQPVEFTDDDE